MKPFTLLTKRVGTISIVYDGMLYFISPDASGEVKTFDPIPLVQFISEDMDRELLPFEGRHREHSLMIVPDYWFGNVSYPFQSKKRSLAEAFLERKLQAEHPELPAIKNFYEFFYQKKQEETWLYTYFMQDENFFRMYEKLLLWNLTPCRTTTPALLWEHKLKTVLPDFNKGGRALVHMLSEECFFYLFDKGSFLFSRNITFPEGLIDSSEKISTLTYEINQSLYLFSQKAKAEIDRIYLLSSSSADDARKLSEQFGPEVKIEISGLEGADISQPVTAGYPAPVQGLTLGDLHPSNNFIAFSHKRMKKEQEWKSVQTTGIVAGLILLLLLLGEWFTLRNWSDMTPFVRVQAGTLANLEPKQVLQTYGTALESLFRENLRPSSEAAIINLARSLPGNVSVKEVTIEVEPAPSMNLKGMVKASGPDQFKETLSILLENLKTYFQGSRSIGIQDVDFEVEESRADQRTQTYFITLRFNLP